MTTSNSFNSLPGSVTVTPFNNNDLTLSNIILNNPLITNDDQNTFPSTLNSITLFNNNNHFDLEPPSSSSLKEPSSSSSSLKRRHSCSHCGKSFSRPSALETHMTVHTGARPFNCTFPGCNKAFSVRSNLKRHSKMHKRPSTTTTTTTSTSTTSSTNTIKTTSTNTIKTKKLTAPASSSLPSPSDPLTTHDISLDFSTIYSASGNGSVFDSMNDTQSNNDPCWLSTIWGPGVMNIDSQPIDHAFNLSMPQLIPHSTANLFNPPA